MVRKKLQICCSSTKVPVMILGIIMFGANFFSLAQADLPDAGVITAPQVQQMREETIDYIVAKQYEFAQQKYSKIIADYPGTEYAMVALGEIGHVYAFQADDAFVATVIDQLYAQYSTQPKVTRAIERVARGYLKWHPAKALAVYTEAINRLSSHPDVVWLHGAIIKYQITQKNLTQVQQSIEALQNDYSEYPELYAIIHFLADTCWNWNEYDKAIELYQYVSQNSSDSDIALKLQRQIAKCQVELGNDTAVDAAIVKLKKDFSAHPQLCKNIYEVAMEYWYNKKFSKAKVFYYFISKNSSDKEMALTSLERALRCEFRLRNYDVLEQALETLNGQNSASEDYVDKVLTICGVYIKANDPALALPYVNSALQASPDAEKTKRLLEIKAKCYAAMGADEQANAILDKIAQSGATDEEFLEALNNTADKYREKKRYEKSIELYQEVLNSNSSQDQKLDARVGIVRSNLKLGNDPNVAAAVKTICDDFADNEKLGRGIITIAEDYYYAKKIELARELSILAHEHTKNPEIAGEGAYIVALCSKKLKDESTQMKYYHIIMEKSPKSLYAYRVPFRMASIYMRQGNYEQAEYWFKKQRQLYDDPSTGGMATFGLAKLYKYGMNDLAKAAEVLENHKQWYPSGPDIRHVYLELAACYQKMGKTEKAVAELQSALEKYTEENYVKRYNKLLSEIQKGSN